MIRSHLGRVGAKLSGRSLDGPNQPIERVLLVHRPTELFRRNRQALLFQVQQLRRPENFFFREFPKVDDHPNHQKQGLRTQGNGPRQALVQLRVVLLQR